MSSFREFDVDGFHIVEAGDPGAPAVLLLHGWPQCWAAWRGVMQAGAGQARLLAVDLPGIGGSAPTGDGSKHAFAQEIHRLVQQLELGHDWTLVGHDCGGMVAYAFLRVFPDAVRRVAILETVVPGVDPWDDVYADARLWHFRLHALPDLPEALVADRQGRYFDFFFDALAVDSSRVTDRATHVAAYASPEQLRAGFDWYRALEADAQRNTADTARIDTPLLYVRGGAGYGTPEPYVEGFHARGVTTVRSAVVPAAGHWLCDEQPEATWKAIAEFIDAT